jgi:hypothetical protein
MALGAHRYERHVGMRVAGSAVFAAMSCLALGLPAMAVASPPSIVTDGASATSATMATVDGSGNPGGLETTLHADYALTSEQWCMSHGEEGTPHETGSHVLGSGNEEISEALVGLTGLNPASEYCTELVAENAGGTTGGGQVSFTTPTPPSIESESASHITAGDATLEATINPEGQETTYEFYVEAPSCLTYGPGHCESSGGKPIFKGTIPAGSSGVSVSVDIAKAWHKLSTNTMDGYRVVASNVANATAYGGEKTFTTLAGPAPSINSQSDSHVTSSDATLEAQIDTEDLETSYQFRLSSICGGRGACLVVIDYPLPSGGLLGSFIDQSVSLDLNSADVTLQPGGTYFYSVSATSAAGTTEGPTQSFTTPEDVVQPLNTTTLPLSGAGPVGFSSGDQPAGPEGSSSSPGVQSPGLLGKTTKFSSLTNAQKLSRALKACEKKPKKQRAKCEKQAHKQFGPVKKKA